MKTFLLVSLLVAGLVARLSAQQNHFVFIQSENRQPFTVNFNNKNYSSTASGYIIIPRVASGQYDFTVKFPKLSVPEAKYSILVDKKDVGFSLKPVESDSWALTNIQTFVTLRSGEKPVYASVTKKEEAASKAVTQTSTKASSAEVSKTTAKLRKGINKVSEVQHASAISLRFIDVQDKKMDTIDIVIPAGRSSRPRSEANRSFTPTNTRMNFLPAETNAESGLSLLAVNQEGYNTACVNLASGEDFYRIRKKMASESNDDRMIAEAKKAAKNKCYTTVQIKNLASLFLTEAGKVKFFAAMYPLVYDYIQFPTLEKELTETPSIDRFRAILH
jgi:hypothetical protein